MLSPDRPLLVVGGVRAFDRYRREYRGARRLEFCPTVHHMRGRQFTWDDIAWLWDATYIRDYAELYDYARHVTSIYDSRDSDESGTVRGRSEATPHTD